MIFATLTNNQRVVLAKFFAKLAARFLRVGVGFLLTFQDAWFHAVEAMPDAVGG